MSFGVLRSPAAGAAAVTVALAGAVVVTALTAQPAAAATPVTLYVDRNGTSNSCAAPGAGACPTVQQAVTAAEKYTASDVTVLIATGTYSENVTVGTVPAGDMLTLRGVGQGSTAIDGSAHGTVVSHSGGSLALESLTITNGRTNNEEQQTPGGGVLSTGGTLRISRAVVANSSAGNGGGVYAHDTSLTIDSSTFLNDLASDSSGGGGVFSSSLTTTIVNSTFFSNFASSGPGANLTVSSYGFYSPKAPPPAAATATITASTFADAPPPGAPPIGNTTGLGVVVPYGYGAARATITGSIVSRSTCVVTGQDATLTDGGGNVESTNTCGFGAASRTSDPNIALASVPAANNHPDAAPTLAIGRDSSARNLVPSAKCPATDERGVSRTGPTCDAGAFEYADEPPPPRAGSARLASRDGKPVSLDLSTLTDTGGQPATYDVVTAPAHGTATITGSVLTYTPTSGYYGFDSLVYGVRTAGGSATGTIDVTDTLAPVVNPDKARTFGARAAPGTTVAIEVLGNDEARGTMLRVSSVSAPGHGSATTDSLVVRYTPAKGFFGTDTFTYTASNDQESATTKVTVIVRR